MQSNIDIDPIIRTNQLVEMLGIHKTTLYRWIKAGDFPAAFRMNKNSIGWRKSTIDEWVEACEANGDE